MQILPQHIDLQTSFHNTSDWTRMISHNTASLSGQSQITPTTMIYPFIITLKPIHKINHGNSKVIGH